MTHLTKRREQKRLSEARRIAKMTPAQRERRRAINRNWSRKRALSLSPEMKKIALGKQREIAKKSRDKRKRERTAEEHERMRQLSNKANRRFYAKFTREKKLAIYEKRRKKDLEELEQKAGRPKPTICELCESGGKLAFDHDHLTGAFRGWLCERCNLTLGQVGDSIEILSKMIAYLRLHGRL